MDSRPTLVIGEEDFLADQIVDELVGRVLAAEDRRLNLDVLDGSLPVGELLTRLDTAPFFGPRRVVVVRRLEAMRDSDHDMLVAYLERGDSPTVGIYMARDLDRRRRLFLTFKRVGIVVEVRPIPPRDLPGWVAQRLLQAGKPPGPGAADALVALAGTRLRDLAQEVEKVAAYVGTRAQVARADVEAIATRVGEASIFRLVDAVGGGDASGALRALHDILATHEPLQVLYMVARQFRLIVRAHTLVGRHGPNAALGDSLGLPPFVARKIGDQARGHQAGEFPGIFDAMEAADRAIKTGSPPRLVLETLLVRLCEMGRRAGPRRGAGVRS